MSFTKSVKDIGDKNINHQLEARPARGTNICTRSTYVRKYGTNYTYVCIDILAYNICRISTVYCTYVSSTREFNAWSIESQAAGRKELLANCIVHEPSVCVVEQMLFCTIIVVLFLRWTNLCNVEYSTPRNRIGQLRNRTLVRFLHLQSKRHAAPNQYVLHRRSGTRRNKSGRRSPQYSPYQNCSV